ncbi:MAG: DUF899 domain-containing protein [Acidobacteria bacterium]|nr:DUF899 domain-containing protein [Acidobacteriota bacterium]
MTQPITYDRPAPGELPYRPPVVTETEWRAALETVLAREKEESRRQDALAAERRRLPMVRIEKDYTFHGPSAGSPGPRSLADLFEGRRQLIVYHFMFAESVHGWPEAGCPGCSMLADQIGHLAHLNARNTSLVFVSRGELEHLERYRRRMGWQVPWYSSAGSTFNVDFGVTNAKGQEHHGLSVFLRDGDGVYRTYFTTDRGAEALGTVWSFLDRTPYGRQETWEDSPAGTPQTPPYQWWRLHDEYAPGDPGA